MPSTNLKPSNNSLFKSLSKNMKVVTANPQDFLRIQHDTCNKIRRLLCQTYDFSITKDATNKDNPSVLPKLVANELEAEQIWQLLELRNNVVWPTFLTKTSNLLAQSKDDLQIKYKSISKKIQNINDNDDHSHHIYANIEDTNNSNKKDSREKRNKVGHKMKSKQKSSIVDDEFFKLNEMEEFLKTEDLKELNKNKNQRLNHDFGINLFDENFENEEEEKICYKDFFKEDNNEDDSNESSNEEIDKNNKFEIDQNENNDYENDPDDNDDDETARSKKNFNSELHLTSEKNLDSEIKEEKLKSSFEERQERLNQRIKDYEQEILGEKPWQLKGEIDATNRPQNSLLEEILEFEATSRPAPIITEETTLRLEDIIRQRIKDQIWDDVELKIKPIGTAQEYRKQLVLDQEKSKESLAHIYEQQYQKELEKFDKNAVSSQEEGEPKSHKEIKEMMEALFVKLDALSNFHFTPKPVAPEPKIITNTPAIDMEEVAPVAVSNAKLLAPEEVKKPSKTNVLGSNERGKTDKNRERRHKKLKQKAINKILQEKTIQKQKMGIKLSKKEETENITKKITKRRNVEKVSTSQDTGSMKSSKAFFSKLNESQQIQRNNLKNKKPQTNSLSAKKLKL